VLVLSCVFVMQGSGCDDEGDDVTIVGGDTLIESLFPGTPISDNNSGNDGQSLSHAELILNQGYVVFRNASNNTAILLYTDRAERLWAHFFDGAGFTPAVEIRGVNQLDYDEDLGTTSGGFGGSDENHQTWRSYQVLFLNTGGSSNANAAARNGDAIIVWNKLDFEPPGGADPDADSNFRLYGTYFDASLASTPVTGDVRHGFDTSATTIDFDNQAPGLGNDDHVSAAGFVSDSLVLTHAYPIHENILDQSEQGTTFELNLEEPTLSGDPTTFVYIVWRKANNDGTGASTGARYHQVQFDLTAATNDVPSEASLGAGVLPVPAGFSIDPGTNVDGGSGIDPSRDSGFVVHNGDMIWRTDILGGGTESTASVLFLTRFGAGVSSATIEFGDTSSSFLFPELPLKTNVYGADHGGLLSLYGFFGTTGAETLHVSKSDLDAPLARETAAISMGPLGGIMELHGTRINRTREWICVVHREEDAGPTNQVHLRAVQARGPGSGARTLANSLSPLVTPANQESTHTDYVTVQSEVANGMTNPFCGVQSDRNRINVAFQQRNQANTFNQRLKHNGLVFTADVTGAAPPTAVAALPGATDGFIDEHDTDYDLLGDDMRPVVTDLGVSSGAPLVYYLRNDNNPTDASAIGAFTEIRVFGRPGVPGGLPTLIGTNGTLVDNTINDPMWDSGEQPIDELSDEAPFGASNFLRVQTTPLNANVGSSPNHGGTFTHVFFEEARGGGNSLWSLKTRVFQKTAFSEAIPDGFGSAHAPPAPTAAPIALDGTGTNPPWVFPTFKDETTDVGVLGSMFVVQGNTVGVFFHSDTHFWYQEFDGSSWYLDAGLGDAQQIDNRFGADAFPGQDQMGYAFPGFSNSSCDDRAGTIACFVRNLPGDDPHVRRLFVRVID
jgi:hypothetical protein